MGAGTEKHRGRGGGKCLADFYLKGNYPGNTAQGRILRALASENRAENSFAVY